MVQWIQINVYPSNGGPMVAAFLKDSSTDKPNSRTISRVRLARLQADSLQDAAGVMDSIIEYLKAGE